MIGRLVVFALCLCASFALPVAAEAQLAKFEGVAISPNGKIVVAVESIDRGPSASTIPAPHHIVLRTIATGAAVRLSCPRRTPCTPSAPVWSPDGSRIAYLVRDDASRVLSVWTASASGSHAVPWLRSFEGVLGAPRWSPDGKTLALLATAGAHKDIGATQAGAALTGDIGLTLREDVQRIAVLGTDGVLHFASPAGLFVYEYDWMPHGRAFVATGAYGNGDDNWWIAKLYRIDGVQRTAHVLAAPGLQINAPRVSPDGSRVAFIGGLMSDFGSVGGDIYTLPINGGAAVDITPGMRASADAISWNGSNERVTFTGVAGAAALLASADVERRTVTPQWTGDERISADSRLDVSFARALPITAVVRETFERPAEIFVGRAGAWRLLTHRNAAAVPAVHTRSVTWKNDGFAVQGWLLSPRHMRPHRTYPMIVEIHGGPSAAARPRFVRRGDLGDYIERGYFVFLPNPRGSFGQGERFAAANVRDFGYGDLRDVLTGIDAVERIAPVDDRRLGLSGWSYGGFMTMFGVTQTHRFRAAFAGAGIANWQSYYGENGIDQWMTPFFGASVYADPAVYAKSSPITFIRNVRTPTFVAVGENDVECPAPQSMEFWHALVTLGVPTSLVIYAGEGHGIRRPADQLDLERRTLRWFDKYLGS